VCVCVWDVCGGDVCVCVCVGCVWAEGVQQVAHMRRVGRAAWSHLCRVGQHRIYIGLARTMYRR